MLTRTAQRVCGGNARRRLRIGAAVGSAAVRGWLKTVAHHAWRDFLDRRRQPLPAGGDSQVEELMLTVEAREDLAQKLEEAFDLELLEAAKLRVRLRVAPQAPANQCACRMAIGPQRGRVRTGFEEESGVTG